MIIIKDKFELVGTKIAEFELPNSRGKTVNIREFENEKSVILVLFRDIHWPYCRWHAAELRRNLDKFEELDGFLFPILADTEENAKKMEQKYARTYAVFYDPSKSVPKLLHQQIKFWKGGRMPGLLIIDKQGIIRYAYYSDSMKDLPKTEKILEILKEINKWRFGMDKMEKRMIFYPYKVATLYQINYFFTRKKS